MLFRVLTMGDTGLMKEVMSVNEPKNFYTMKGYALNSAGAMTSAMEDYLEMMARLERQGDAVRVSELSKLLHVKAPSVTKMVQHLSKLGYVTAERYGKIALTKNGGDIGEYLLYRHDVLHRFLCLLNNSGNELEQVEKIEHFLDRRTIENLEQLIIKLQAVSPSAGQGPD